MRRDINKLLKVFVPLIICLLGIFVTVAIKYQDNKHFQMIEIYKFPTTISSAELEKKGFINLTEVKHGSIWEITDFFSSPRTTNNRLLKTFSASGEELVIRVFERDDSAQQIYMTTYYVETKGVENSNLPFEIEIYEVGEDSEITEVWLRSALPNGKDFLLYRYETSD